MKTKLRKRPSVNSLCLVPIVRAAPAPPLLQFNEHISTGHYRYCWRYATYVETTWSPAISDAGEIPVFRSIAEASAAARAHDLPTGRMCVVGLNERDWEERLKQWDDPAECPLVDYHASMRFTLAREKMLACKGEGIGSCVAHYADGTVSFEEED